MDFWSRYAPSALAGKEGRSTDATLVASIRQVSFSSDTRRWDQPDRPCRSIRLALLPTHEHPRPTSPRSEEHTTELQSLMRLSYAVFCLNKKNCVNKEIIIKTHQSQTQT